MRNDKPINEIARLIAAFGHGCEGLKAVCLQPAFRIELAVSAVMAPLAMLAGKSGMERAMLISSLILVLMVELLNTGIETAIDRISTEWNALSKIAKDVGSAAVLLSLINAAVVWLMVVCF